MRCKERLDPERVEFSVDDKDSIRGVQPLEHPSVRNALVDFPSGS